MTELSPIVTPGKIEARSPIHTFEPIEIDSMIASVEVEVRPFV